MMVTVFPEYGWAKASAEPTRTSNPTRALVARVAMIVVVHQLFWHVRKQLARRRRGGADPFHAAALARRLAQIVEREQRRVLRHLEPLRQRGEDQLAHLAPAPAPAPRGDLFDLPHCLQHPP